MKQSTNHDTKIIDKAAMPKKRGDNEKTLTTSLLTAKKPENI